MTTTATHSRQDLDPATNPETGPVGLLGEIVLIGSGVFGSLALSALSPVLPEIQAAFADTPSAAFWTKAIVTIDGIAMIAAPFAGFMAARLGGPRRLMILSYLLFLVAGLAGALMPGLYTIIFTRFLVGIGGAMLTTLAVTLIGDRFADRAREARIGFNHATGAALIALMVMLSGWLGDHFGWRASFAVHLLAVPFLLCALASPELAQFRVRPAKDSSANQPLVGTVPIALLALVAGSIALSVPIFLPFHIKEIGVDSALVAAQMFTLVAGVSVLSSLMFGLVRRILSGAAVFGLAFLLWSVGLTIAGMSENLSVLATGVVIIGAGGGLVQPSIFSLLARMSSAESLARNNGLVKGCFYGGPFIGTSLLQLMLGHYPAGISLVALAVLALLMLLIAVPIAGINERRHAATAQ